MTVIACTALFSEDVIHMYRCERLRLNDFSVKINKPFLLFSLSVGIFFISHIG